MILKKNLVLIISACVCLLLFALYFIISSLPEEGEDIDGTDNAYLYIDQTDTDDIIRFSFIGGEFDFSFEKDSDGNWRYTKNHSLPVSGDTIDKTLSHIELFLATKSVANNVSEKGLSEYGLESPSYTLKLTLKNETKTYLFGDFIESKGLYYATPKGSGAVYLTERSYVDNFSLEVADFLTFDQLTEIKAENVLYVTVLCGEYSQKITADGTKESDGYKFISALCDIKLEEFVDFGSENFSIYGLSESDAVSVYITFSDGETENIRTTAFKFGLGETEEFNYLLVGDTLTQESVSEHSFSEMVYLFSSSDDKTIYSFISKAFGEKN